MELTSTLSVCEPLKKQLLNAKNEILFSYQLLVGNCL